MNPKGKRLFEEISRGMNIVEDAYLVPDKVSYYDVEDVGDNIWFYSAEGTGHDSMVIFSLGVYEKELGDWDCFRTYLKNALKDSRWMTVQASEVIQKMISFYAE